MVTVTFLLPSPDRLVGRLPAPVARVLGQADRLPHVETGERAQLLRYFDVHPFAWPIAALTREADIGDAGSSTWLRADPAWLRADINGARMFACGDGLQLATEDVEALLPALQPLFLESGCFLDAPVPSRWYVRLPDGIHLPVFAEPADALGADVFDYLPADNASTSARSWRNLLNETQVVLHNHPWNAHRAASGKPPVNSLWFWGAGALPDRVTAHVAAVQSTDSVLRALAGASAASLSVLPRRFETPAADTLIDLRGERDIASLAGEWIEPASAKLGKTMTALQLDFAEGDGYFLDRTQRWRIWRKPVMSFGLPCPAIGA